LKPDLVAPDNVTTASYMPEKFRGSSVSVPYAAGIFALALEKGRKLGLSDAEIESLLLNNTIDLGPSGADNEYGRGLINLKSFAKL
jgi:subtilisin family serine protease